MGVRGKQRKGSATGDKRAGHAGEVAQALYAKGEFKRAAYALLPSANRGEASPDEVRLLASCYLQLDNPAEALNWLSSLPEQSPADLSLGGRCLLAQGRWKDADARFAAAAKAGDGAAALGRAEVFLRRRAPVDLSSAERARYAELLAASTILPDCPWQAYETLADLRALAGDASGEAEVLRAAVVAHPGLPEARLRLGRLLLDCLDDRPAALTIVEPLLGDGDSTGNPEALWLALRATRATSDRRGLTYVERLRPFFSPEGVGPDKLAGDVHLRLGEVAAALARYEAEIRRSDPTAQLVGLFSRTAALLIEGSVEEVLATARLALGKWLASWSDGADLPWLCPGGGTLAISLAPAEEGRTSGCQSVSYPFADDLERVCRRLSVVGFLPEPEIAAQASCLLYSLHGCPDSSEGQDWLLAASALGLPRLGERLARHFLVSGKLAPAIEQILAYCCWLADHSNDESASEGVVADFARKAGPLAVGLDGTARLAVHRVALASLAARPDARLVRLAFVPFFRDFWRELLDFAGSESERLRLAERLLRSAPGDMTLLLDRAETFARLGLLDSAEKAYREALRTEPMSAEAHRGLSAILEKRQALREAVKHSAEALRLAPSAELAIRHESLQARLSEEEQRGPDRADLLKSAPYRWRLLSAPERTLLGVLSVISGFRDWEHLAKLTGLRAEALPNAWQRLVDLGMISWSTSQQAFEVNEHIRTLLVADHPGAVLSRVIAGGTETAVKCVFNSTLEADTYRALIEVFPNHLVLPDVALTALFDYQQMQSLLTPADFPYFSQARVDFCVVGTTNYVPFLAIEADSHYHDESVGVERDRAKDAIFQLGGLPLLRFRPVGNHDSAAIRDQLQELVRALRDELRGQIARGGFRNARTGLQQIAPQ